MGYRQRNIRLQGKTTKGDAKGKNRPELDIGPGGVDIFDRVVLLHDAAHYADIQREGLTGEMQDLYQLAVQAPIAVGDDPMQRVYPTASKF